MQFPNGIKYLFLLEVAICATVFIYNIIQGDKANFSPDIVYFNAILFGAFFIVTLVIFFFCLRIMQKNHELLAAQQEKVMMEDYMKKLEDLYQNTRLFKHDYINLLATMQCYIEESDTEALKKFFREKILPSSQKLSVKEDVIGRLSNIKVLEIKGILYAKLIAAMNQDINISLEVREPICSIPMDTLDLSIVIGIFLDNAIEAALESEERKIAIALINNQDGITIIITNSTASSNINLDKIYNKDVSTKEGHAGLGLYSANITLSKYNNTIHTTNFHNQLFSQTLDVYITT